MTDENTTEKDESPSFVARKGFRNKKAMTQGQLSQKAADTDNILVQIQNALQGLGRQTMMGMMQLQQEMNVMRQQLLLAGYRAAALQKLAVERGLFSEEDIQAASDALRLRDFENSAAEEDKSLGLVDGGEEVKLGDYVTFKLDAEDEGGGKLAQLSLFRGRVWVGQGTLVAAIEDAMIGMKIGQPKEFIWVPATQEFPALSGKTLNVKIEIFSIKTRPAPTEEESAAVAEQLEGLARQVEEVASAVEEKAEELTQEEPTNEETPSE